MSQNSCKERNAGDVKEIKKKERRKKKMGGGGGGGGEGEVINTQLKH